VTKQFTAASILLLEERGKLSVNDPVNKFMA
jgi:CubicO group peptidase (beta-lactamase class C family)